LENILTPLNSKILFSIYSKVSELPEDWNSLAVNNIFLSKEYLEILEKSAPKNMICHYIGLFLNDKLVGITLSQFLDLNKLESFGDRDKCIKTSVRNFVFKNLCSNVLFIGNNMLSGQNAFSFSEEINKKELLQVIGEAYKVLKIIFRKNGKKIHITTFKDFDSNEITEFKKAGFEEHYQFSTQPNMIFEIPEKWKSEQNYIDALSKKYRDQYKRSRKRAEGIEKRKFHLQDIIKYEETIYDLYFHVAQNAPFNTFYLAKNHFRVFKEIMKDKFLFYGYFLDDKLIGFNTLIKNGDVMDTYFLGYDDTIQKEKMLYLNMLYDMIAYSINKGFKKIIFARTALEIKSSVGAKPYEMYGLMEHCNTIVSKNMGRIFDYLEPKTEWNERNPYK
jgi:predicted N-acyltransferase